MYIQIYNKKKNYTKYTFLFFHLPWEWNISTFLDGFGEIESCSINEDTMFSAHWFSSMLLYTPSVMKPHLSLALRPRQLHLLQQLWALLHHQRLLVGEGRDVTVMLEKHDKRSVTAVIRSATHTKRSVTAVIRSATHTKRSVTAVIRSATHTKRSVTAVIRSATHTKRSVTAVIRSATHTKRSVTAVIRSATHTKRSQLQQ